jgi:hypothetical protein
MARLQAQLINARNNNNNNDIESDASIPRCGAKINMCPSTAFLELQQQVTDEDDNAVVDGNGGPDRGWNAFAQGHALWPFHAAANLDLFHPRKP